MLLVETVVSDGRSNVEWLLRADSGGDGLSEYFSEDGHCGVCVWVTCARK